VSKHRTERCRDIAWQGTILLSEVGSTLHGVTASTTGDDLDLMGICIPPTSCVTGLEQFEQFEGRWHKDGTPIKDGERSGVGDTDLTIYSLRKWAKLAADGNPTVQLILFSPANKVYHETILGEELRRNSDLFVSKLSGQRYLGYLRSQVQLMLGLRAGHTNRPELIEKYGIDTKAAYHACRLGIQGIELMQTGRVTLPMPDHHRETLIGLRTGQMGDHTRQWTLEYLAHLESELFKAIDASDLPDKPDAARIDAWLDRAHQTHWR
jgi:uncharacterized protein